MLKDKQYKCWSKTCLKFKEYKCCEENMFKRQTVQMLWGKHV